MSDKNGQLAQSNHEPMTEWLVGPGRDDDDAATALRLARAARASESEVWALLAEVQERAERLLRTPEVTAAVECVARELYARRELSGAEIDQLLEGALDGP